MTGVRLVTAGIGMSIIVSDDPFAPLRLVLLYFDESGDLAFPDADFDAYTGPSSSAPTRSTSR